MEEPGGILTLGQALALALQKHPALKALVHEKRAKDELAFQAGLRPNPELAIDVENIAGSDSFTGLDSSETTLQLSQLIELGGKRNKRLRVASLDSDRTTRTA